MKPQYFNNELIFKCGVFPLLSPSSHIPLTLSELLSSNININFCHSFILMHVTTIIVLILADYVCIIIMYVYSDIVVTASQQFITMLTSLFNWFLYNKCIISVIVGFIIILPVFCCICQLYNSLTRDMYWTLLK